MCVNRLTAARQVAPDPTICTFVAGERTVMTKPESLRTSLAVAAVLLMSVLVHAQNQDFSKVQIKVTKIAVNIYMLQGSGGNIAASVGEDGIVMVDDEYAPLADKITAALKGVGGEKPVRLIFNTHYHGDHTNGNLAFAGQGAIMIAPDDLRKRLASGGKHGIGNGPHQFKEDKPAPAGALPIITFDHEITVHFNGEDIRAVHFPAAHTDGDAIVFFTKANVVHMGDIYVRYGFPFIDLLGGGSVQGTIAACEKVIAEMPSDAKVVPGHGDLASLQDLREYLKMLQDTRTTVQKAIDSGKTVEQMKKEKILEAWAPKYSNDFVSADVFIDTLYNSLTNSKKAASAQQ